MVQRVSLLLLKVLQIIEIELLLKLVCFFLKQGGHLESLVQPLICLTTVEGEKVPNFDIVLENEEDKTKVIEFISALENHEDVQQVYHNAKF